MLHELTTDHPDRNRQLSGCWYKKVNGKEWRDIKPTYKIAKTVYNDLGPAWTEICVFSWNRIDTTTPVS